VQAYTVGVVVTFYDVNVVIQAFFLTSAVVVGLTAFTFQSKRDFSSWGSG
jgi:FtsH-binding integral membrane protein